MHRFLGRVRGQAGSVQTFVLSAAALLLITGALATSSFAFSSANGGTEQVARSAEQGAQILAGEQHGSYAGVNLLSLHKVAGVAITPASGRAWLSAARGDAGGYSLTVTDPSGHTYSIAARLSS